MYVYMYVCMYVYECIYLLVGMLVFINVRTCVSNRLCVRAMYLCVRMLCEFPYLMYLNMQKHMNAQESLNMHTV